MCGIAGGFWTVNPKNLNQLLEKAIKQMRYRGPNDNGTIAYKTNLGYIAALAHTRLSVIDLSDAGHQPMQSRCGNYSLVYNGEIYNYKELKAELLSLGHIFYTNTDSEVLLNSWMEWGINSLSKFNGMFAFAILDRKKNIITCARDPFGIKPLYYFTGNNTFFFASEIKALHNLTEINPKLNSQRAFDYLMFGDYDNQKNSFFQDTYHLLPGHFITFDLNLREISDQQKWHKLDVTENFEISFEDAIDTLREKFLKSIKLHMRSDVSIGAALSGGIDSSSIVCAMKYLEPHMEINTFSFIDSNEGALSEKKWIDIVNNHVKAKSFKTSFNGNDLIADLDDLIISQGEPFASTSIYAQYRVFKLAKENGITVTLDGQGADELLAGYHGYPAKRIHSLLDQKDFCGIYHFLKGWSTYPGRSLRNGAGLLLNEFFSRRKKIPSWIEKEQGEMFYDKYKKIHEINFSEKKRRLVSHLLKASTRHGLPGLLRHGDRNSMRFSIESRVPFLSNDIANFLFSLPENFLISNYGETKHIFRFAMKGVVPDEILSRKDKIGFETPEKKWVLDMSNDIKKWIKKDISVPFLKQEYIQSQFDLICDGKLPFGNQVWRWINFIRWYQLNF